MDKAWWSCRSFRSRQTLPTVHSLPRSLRMSCSRADGISCIWSSAREKAISKFLQWIQSQV